MFLGRSTGESTETVVSAKKYLTSSKRSKEKIVANQSGNVVIPRKQGSMWRRPASKPGKPPRTHPSDVPGLDDFWLKKSIRFDPKNGVVFVNPPNKGWSPVSQTLPILLEEGGTADYSKLVRNVLEGYYVYKTNVNGETQVSYTPYFRKINSKHYQAHPRPFLKPALVKAADKLLKILENSIGK